MTRFTLGLPFGPQGDDERFSDRGFIAEAAEAAESMGFWGMTAPDHILSPAAWARAGGGDTWFDPFVTLGFVAARTERLRLITHVVILPYRTPFHTAKAIASLDRISDGRAVLGVGSGYLEEEVAILGAGFADRGARTDEALRAIAACLAGGDIEFEGEYHSVRDARMGPLPVQERIPVWSGGNSWRALRRAVELGDCWAPFRATPERIREAVERSEALGRRVEIAAGLGRVSKEPVTGDGIVGAGDVAPRIKGLTEAGADYVKCGFAGASPAEWMSNLEWFAAEALGG